MTKSNDIYETVTNRIISELENGLVPWVQPWAKTHHSTNDIGLPSNPTTGNFYSGVNILILWDASFEQGFTSQKWLTFQQAKKAGGTVNKGSKSTQVVYASQFIPKDEQKRVNSEGGEPVAINYLKKYNVFNVAQCEGLPASFYQDVSPLPECEVIPIAERLIAATGADFRIGGDRACFVPKHDFIMVPHQSSFTDEINFYRTAFHELGHWTGAKSRLDRNLKNHFGDPEYAREELVAEMTSAFVCATLGIQPTVRHTDYIGSWLTVLKNDKRAIFQAASKASQAANFILAYQEQESLGMAA